ncbi:translation initiation factor IF-2-like [Moschus berezovskii]|uniref:translation initiation factor IF-2-like n=1 Tax=Moschus berezovskii TaxID=68408 RepID=UPI002443D509|nr:translation initiation factor IF-2-like [Moschus berezovskii]
MAGALQRSQRRSPRTQAKPGPSPPSSQGSPGGTSPPGARPNERTASSAEKARPRSPTAPLARKSPMAGGRAGGAEPAPATADPTRDGARGNSGAHRGEAVRARGRGWAPSKRAGGPGRRPPQSLLRASTHSTWRPREPRGFLSPASPLTHRRGRPPSTPGSGPPAGLWACQPAQAQTLTDPELCAERDAADAAEPGHVRETPPHHLSDEALRGPETSPSATMQAVLHRDPHLLPLLGIPGFQAPDSSSKAQLSLTAANRFNPHSSALHPRPASVASRVVACSPHPTLETS